MADDIRTRHDIRVDQERMSLGDHLEELRRRIIRSLLGLLVAVAVCFYFAQDVVTWLCQPLVLALSKGGLNPRLYQEQVPQLFLNYMKLAILSGLILASPWIIYQLWMFVAAGLYSHEQRFVRVYGPASLGLFLAGAAFVYFIAMPFALKYFIEFNQMFRPPDPGFQTPVQRLLYSRSPPRPAGPTPATGPHIVHLPVLDSPPAPADPGAMWIDAATGQLQYYHQGRVKALPPISDSLVAPWFNLEDYLDFFILMMLACGVGFQTPLVILFLARTGLVPTESLARKRRAVILVLVILAAVLTPTGDAISLFLLALPMWGLFELGLLLGRRAERPNRPARI